MASISLSSSIVICYESLSIFIMQKVTGSTLGYLKHDAVEECAVVIAFAHQAEEVVAVLRRFVVEAKGDVA